MRASSSRAHRLASPIFSAYRSPRRGVWRSPHFTRDWKRCADCSIVVAMFRIVLCLAFFGSVSAATSAEPESTAQEGRFLANARQLIYEARRSGEGYFDPAGTRLVFQSERDPENPF